MSEKSLIEIWFEPEIRDALLNELELSNIKHSKPRRASGTSLNAPIDINTIEQICEVILVSAQGIETILKIIDNIRKRHRNKHIEIKR